MAVSFFVLSYPRFLAESNLLTFPVTSSSFVTQMMLTTTPKSTLRSSISSMTLRSSRLRLATSTRDGSSIRSRPTSISSVKSKLNMRPYPAGNRAPSALQTGLIFLRMLASISSSLKSLWASRSSTSVRVLAVSNSSSRRKSFSRTFGVYMSGGPWFGVSGWG